MTEVLPRRQLLTAVSILKNLRIQHRGVFHVLRGLDVNKSSGRDRIPAPVWCRNSFLNFDKVSVPLVGKKQSFFQFLKRRLFFLFLRKGLFYQFLKEGSFFLYRYLVLSEVMECVITTVNTDVSGNTCTVIFSRM